MKRLLKVLLPACLVAGVVLAAAGTARAEGVIPVIPGVERTDDPDKVVTTLEILLLLTVLAIAPSILVLTTAFTRIVIVLSFVRRSLGTQDLPPNSILIGLSLLLTFMVMAPTFRRIKTHAVVPYMDNRITQKEAIQEAIAPMRKFMLDQTRRKDIRLFLDITKTPVPAQARNEDIPTEVLVPAFVISELRRAFIMGFAIFLPFLVIDLVVSTTLISMGMLVLPPVLISMPFKILLFILVDGWHLTVGSLVKSFY
ncbi:MAG: flagellar type III secretion system pore protein FliP [Candidatus Brocadiae bacterium]|nr:flagellar type III secretion system pore protein FliP [Candidatus Brocadiia bacterium]